VHLIVCQLITVAQTDYLLHITLLVSPIWIGSCFVCIADR